MERKAASIYYRHFSGEQTQNASNKQHAGSYPYFYRNAAASIHILFDTKCKDGKQQVDQRSKFMFLSFCMARRIWCVFLFEEPGTGCDTLYYKPGNTSSKDYI